MSPEYAEYTSAQERIALGKKSKKAEAKKRREEMNELIADAYVSSSMLYSALSDVCETVKR